MSRSGKRTNSPDPRLLGLKQELHPLERDVVVHSTGMLGCGSGSDIPAGCSVLTSGRGTKWPEQAASTVCRFVRGRRIDRTACGLVLRNRVTDEAQDGSCPSSKLVCCRCGRRLQHIDQPIDVGYIRHRVQNSYLFRRVPHSSKPMLYLQPFGRVYSGSRWLIAPRHVWPS